MDHQSHEQYSVEQNYLPIPRLQQNNRWSVGMEVISCHPSWWMWLLIHIGINSNMLGKGATSDHTNHGSSCALTKTCIFTSFSNSPTFIQKKIERHTADTIVSWPNPKQWVIFHTSDSMKIIRQSIYIISIITRLMGKLKTYSPTYCILDNLENMLNLTHTLDKIYLKCIL